MAELGQILLPDEAATVAAGMRLAQGLSAGLVLFLEGQLGAGKTTLTRGILQQLGHVGAVKSPTYTLVEPYEHLALPTYHFDLYRLADPEELAYVGIRDYFTEDSVCLIEWAERGKGFLPEADIQLELRVQPLSSGTIGRSLTITAASKRGERLLAKW